MNPRPITRRSGNPEHGRGNPEHRRAWQRGAMRNGLVTARDGLRLGPKHGVSCRGGDIDEGVFASRCPIKGERKTRVQKLLLCFGNSFLHLRIWIAIRLRVHFGYCPARFTTGSASGFVRLQVRLRIRISASEDRSLGCARGHRVAPLLARQCTDD